MTSMSWSANVACAARIRAPRSSTTWPAMYAFVNPRGMCTGLMTGYDSGRSKIAFIRTASSSAGWPSSITVRCPTGLMNPVSVAAPPEAVDQPERGRGLAAVLAGRGEVELAHPRRVAGAA